MSESSPDRGVRPVAAKGAPANVTAPSRENRSLLFPETDPDDDGPHQPSKPRRFQRFTRPVAYVACAVAGAVIVTAVYGLMGPRPVSGSRAGADSAPARSAVNDPAVLDRRADTLALAVAAFSMRARMFDTRRMTCPGLARGLQQVEDGWLAYNIARKDLMVASDPARDARDKNLYADVRAVEARFERSSCARP